jgi:hypothetical protein
MPITASDLWEEYRQRCCQGEHGAMLEQARLSFLSGVVSTCATIMEGADPADLALSVEAAFADAVADHQSEQAEMN